MDTLHRLTSLLGGKTLSILALIVACFVVLSGFWYQQQQVIDTAQSQARQLRQRLVETTFSNVSSEIKYLTDKVSIAADVNEMVMVFEDGREKTLNLQQRLLTRGIPEAKTVCLMGLDVDEPDPNACVPINFAILGLLREAKAQKEAIPFAVVETANKQYELVITKQVSSSQGNVVGVLLATFDAGKILALLPKLEQGEGYIALQQGKAEKTALAFRGDVQWKTGSPEINHQLKNSYWSLGYWSPPEEDLERFWGIVAAVLAGLALLWLWRDFWQGTLLRKDMAVVKEQVHDWKQNTLKHKYFVGTRSAKDLVKTILGLGVLREATGQQATAETMNLLDETVAPAAERMESVMIEEDEPGNEPLGEQIEPATVEVQDQEVEMAAVSIADVSEPEALVVTPVVDTRETAGVDNTINEPLGEQVEPATVEVQEQELEMAAVSIADVSEPETLIATPVGEREADSSNKINFENVVIPKEEPTLIPDENDVESIDFSNVIIPEDQD